MMIPPGGTKLGLSVAWGLYRGGHSGFSVKLENSPIHGGVYDYR